MLGVNADMTAALAVLDNLQPDKTVPELTDIAEGVLRDHLQNVLDKWPVDTGNSKDGFYVDAEYDEKGFEAHIGNTEPYAQYVHRKGSTTLSMDELFTDYEEKLENTAKAEFEHYLSKLVE